MLEHDSHELNTTRHMTLTQLNNGNIVTGQRENRGEESDLRQVFVLVDKYDK